MEKPIIQIQNMGKTFKTANGLVKALDQINLDICQGEIFGIIGLGGKKYAGAVYQLSGGAHRRPGFI